MAEKFTCRNYAQLATNVQMEVPEPIATQPLLTELVSIVKLNVGRYAESIVTFKEKAQGLLDPRKLAFGLVGALLLNAPVVAQSFGSDENWATSVSDSLYFSCGERGSRIAIRVDFHSDDRLDQTYHFLTSDVDVPLGNDDLSLPLEFPTEAYPILARLECLSLASSDENESFEYRVVFTFAPKIRDSSECKMCVQSFLVNSSGMVTDEYLLRVLGAPGARELSYVEIGYEHVSDNIWDWFDLREGK